MAETKLSKARIPRRKPKEEPKKLGLLTKGNRRMVTFRMSVETMGILDDMIDKNRHEVFHSISKTDILETAILCLSRLDHDDFVKICQEYGLKKAK